MTRRALSIILITIVSMIMSLGTAFAETLPGRVEGAGTHFVLTDSTYKNLTLDSTESIYVFLESVTETVSLQIEPVSTATQTQITLSGLAPSTTYYKYQDNYYNLQTFTTDLQGRFSYTQDLSQVHLVFIQPRSSTIHLSNSGWSKPVGTWDPVTKTARLTTDLDQAIQIQDDGITLLGDDHLITGAFSGSGIFINGRSNVIIKNVKVKNFSHGIYLFNSSEITICNTTLESNTNGLYIKGSRNAGSNNNTVYNNNFVSNNIQTYLDSNSNNNRFSLPLPTGGNYWNNFTSPDQNGDRIVDVPYSFFGVTDNFPWNYQEGWINSTVPPITTLSTSPLSPDGNEGWFKSRPTITLASDKPGVTYYSWTSATGPWTTYTGSFQVSDGAKTLYYYSVDTAGTAEAVKSQIIKVDTVAPSVSTLSAVVISDIRIDLSWPVSTDGTSGVSRYQVYDAKTDSLISTLQTASFLHNNLLMGQTYSYYIKVIDKAGNVSGQSNTITLTTPQEISAPIGGGTNIEVNPGGGLEFIFNQVTEGTISVALRSFGYGQPPGYRIVRDSSYDITTTSTYSGPVKIKVPYNPTDIVGEENDIKLFHWKNNSWVDITESVDTANKTISGTTTSFSPFTVAEELGSSGSPAVGGEAFLPEIFIE